LPFIFVTPPKINSVILNIDCPYLIAIKEWESSCSATDTNSRSDAITPLIQYECPGSSGTASGK